MSSNDPVVGVLLKVPRVGRVKTRLGSAIGMENAAEFYATCLGWLLGRLRRSGVRHVLFYDPPGKLERLRRLYGSLTNVERVSQRGENLGERMKNALMYLTDRFEEAPMLIGSDSPDLPMDRIGHTARALRRHELVLGPARDGGYYLIGTRRPVDPLFTDISWSEPTVLQTTLDRAREHGIDTHLLEPWGDVDTLEDLIEKM